MILSISDGAINVLLDYIFVVLMEIGIAGSALGTGIGYLIPTIIGIAFFAKAKGTLRFKKPVIDFRVLWKSGANGFSVMVSQISTAVTTFLFCGFNIFASATFTALSNGKVSAIISMLRTFVFISLALLILPQIFGAIGVWIAVPLAELLTIFVSLIFIIKNNKVYHYL